MLGLLVGMAVAHPAGRDQLPSLVRLDRRMATLAFVTAVGAVVFAGIELSAHFSRQYYSEKQMLL